MLEIVTQNCGISLCIVYKNRVENTSTVWHRCIHYNTSTLLFVLCIVISSVFLKVSLSTCTVRVYTKEIDTFELYAQVHTS